MSKQLLIQAALYVIIAGLTPISSKLASNDPITTRSIIAMSVFGLIAGATALKAFLSTTFAQSKESELPIPPLALKRK